MLNGAIQADPPCAYFDPEGLFTTLGGATSSVLIGIPFGWVLRNRHPGSPQLCFVSLAVPSSVMLLAGGSLHWLGVSLINKMLYSPSYILATAGLAGLVLACVYMLVDVWRLPAAALIFTPLQWLGMNSIAVFVGDELADLGLPLVYWKHRNNNLKTWLFRKLFVKLFQDGSAAVLAFAFADSVFWTLVAGALHWQTIYFKV